MEPTNYVFFRTFFDKEELRQALLLLKNEKIDFNLVDKKLDKSLGGSFKAPLSVYFEVDLMISESDFDRVDKLLQGMLD